MARCVRCLVTRCNPKMVPFISMKGNNSTIIGTKYVQCLALLVLLAGWPGLAQQSTDLSNASLEDLMNIQVTSVSKKEQKLSQAGAAIFVITQEDIRRSGATNIPDLLRLAPGVDVARVSANQWAISIRGFSDLYANKVLVLIDGLSVYSPSFTGVFWDMVNVPLEDIDRIEVIRGPGGTMWGADAVNGVINIITKSSKATQGGLISTGAGSQDHADGVIQYGGGIGQTGAYRITANYFDIGSSVFPNGQQAADGWQSGHAGFRSDWDLSQSDTLTVQGDFVKTAESNTITTLFSDALPLTKTFNDPVAGTTGNILARWNHTLANGSTMSLQMYDDASRHLDLGFTNVENTFDVDFQHHIALGSWNDVVWGLGTRFIDSAYSAGYAISIVPNRRFDSLLSAFLQDQLKLTNTLSLTVGTKAEHNDFTGPEFEPSAQLVWTPTGRQTVWASAARAIREPSPTDDGVQDDVASFPSSGSSFALVKVFGNPWMKAEELRDFETGYRAQVSNHISLDVTGFAGFYRNLEEVTSESPYFATTEQGVLYTVLPELFVNGPPARTYGLEFSGNWNVTDHWRISPGYSYFHIDVDGNSSALETPPGTSPNHQFQIRSLLDLPHHLEWDNTVGYVSKLAVGNVPGYPRLDSRLGWRMGEFVEFSIVGQDLLTPTHLEFFDTDSLNRTLVERSFFGKVDWRF